jgi:integrase/recombinase XerD
MIKKNIQVVLFPQIKTDGTKPIKVRTIINRKVQYINLGISVGDNHWDNRKQRVKSNHPEYKKYNTLIEKHWKKLYVVEPEEIVTKQSKSESLLFVTLGQIMKKRIVFERSRNRISIEKKLTTSLRHLTKSGLHKTDFIEFNLDKIKQFHMYLFTIDGLQENSMGTYHRVLRSTLNLYFRENEISSKTWSDPYKNFKTVKKSKPKFSLKGSQVIKLENYILFNKRKEGDKFNSVCMFVFSIYSFGSRFGDIYNWKWD